MELVNIHKGGKYYNKIKWSFCYYTFEFIVGENDSHVLTYSDVLSFSPCSWKLDLDLVYINNTNKIYLSNWNVDLYNEDRYGVTYRINPKTYPELIVYLDELCLRYKLLNI